MAGVYAGPVRCGVCDASLPDPLAGDHRCGRCGASGIRVHRFRPFRKTVAAAALPAVAGTPCAYHAGNLAVAPCARCGSFLCDLCTTPLQGRTYCTACFERLHADGGMESLKNRYPRPHSFSLALGALSLLLVFVAPVTVPLGIWQWIRAWRTRAEILEREGRVLPHLVFAALLMALAVALGVVLLVGALT